MNLTPDGPHFLDTSAVIALMRQGVTAAQAALVPFATMAELLMGMERGINPARERARMQAAIGMIPVIYPESQTLASYARASTHLRRIGQPIPINDLWNAALALQWDLPLLADDAHFSRVQGLKLISIR